MIKFLIWLTAFYIIDISILFQVNLKKLLVMKVMGNNTTCIQWKWLTTKNYYLKQSLQNIKKLQLKLSII